MARFTEPLFSSQFATGVTYYRDDYPGEEGRSLIVLAVIVEKNLTIEAVVDTGAPWCVLDPQIAEQVGVSAETTYASSADRVSIGIRGYTLYGALHRMRIGFYNEQEGNDLEVEATVFVPDLHAGAEWDLPNFIGLNGFLERIRFAVDPAENAFYFAPV